MDKKTRMSLVLAFFLCLLVVTYQLPSLQLGVSCASDQFSGSMIDLYTQKEPYGGKGSNQPSDAFAPQEEVVLYACVTYNGFPRENMLVDIEVHDPSGACVVVGTVETDENGITTMSFRIPWSGENAESVVFGTWSALAAVEIEEERVSDTLTFEVGWIVEIVSIRTVDENLQSQTIFTKGTYVGVEMLLRNIAMAPKNVTLTFVAYDNSSHPINSSVILDFEAKQGVSYTYCILSIPKWAVTGYATVFANARTRTALQQLGSVLCPEVSVRFVLIPRNGVAIIGVTPAVTELYVGQVVNITIVAKNEGAATETFKVTAYYDETIIGTQNVTDLAPGKSNTLTFSWNTSGVPEGNYTLKAVASTVLGETEIVNNEYANGIITVKLPPKYLFPREFMILALIVTLAIVVNGVAILLYRRKPSSALSIFIKRFLTNLNAAGGVMSEEAFLDLFIRTETEMKLCMDPIKVYDALQMLRVVARAQAVPNTTKTVWILTLKGLQFAGLSIDQCCYFA